jgi:hypothetical protein
MRTKMTRFVTVIGELYLRSKYCKSRRRRRKSISGLKRPVFEKAGLSASHGLIVLDIADGDCKAMKRFILKVASSSLSVLQAVLVKASKMLEEPPPEMSVQWNKKIMRKLEMTTILVG